MKFEKAFEYKVIYVFEIKDETHKGLVKIGDATIHTDKTIEELTPNCRDLNQAALTRIKQYTNTVGCNPVLLHTELAVREDDNELKAFRDHEVHRVLKNSDIKNTKLKGSDGREWFKIDVVTAKRAIDAVKKGIGNLSNTDISTHVSLVLRPEQEAAVEQTLKQFKKGNRMLWNAKMRFGKTVCALEVAKRLDVDHTIIITHRPVVNEGWYEDFSKVFYGKECLYGSKTNGNNIDDLLKMQKMPFVYFASIQDLRGSSLVGGKFEKNSAIFDMDWDLVIVDEAHEGTTTMLGDEVIKNIVKEDSEHETKFLALSGTPFNIMTDFDENEVYTWDYMMEQERKLTWDKYNFCDSNPYEELPELKIYTYDLGKLLGSSYIDVADAAFNFHEFFRTWTGDISKDYVRMPKGTKIGEFVHEADITNFLNLMTKEDDDSLYPYATREYRDIFRHSLWMMPGVKEARALKELMMKHPVFGSGAFNIVNVAGNGDEEESYDDALKKVKTAINETLPGNYTITLSCGKLTTGVTVREWTAVFMLSGTFSTSAANYLQTIFRVQSPCNTNGQIKERGFVFDFAPDRTLKMVAEAVSISSKAGKTSGEDKYVLGKFLNFCPVISISGSEMQEYSTDRLLQQLKKAYADRVVRSGFDDVTLYNDELLQLSEVDIEKFDELKSIIGRTKASAKTNDIKVNEQGLTKEEYEELKNTRKKKKSELTAEEKARLEELKRLKKLRSDAISILRGISIRMPLLIYGADIEFREEVTIDNFTKLVDDVSWEEFMPKGVTKNKFNEFKKYYDPDIFIAAGRRIRNIAKSADDLEPTERVKKIASLFAYFKNPDKETVLTPWRVVNMHMSECLGGYTFYDKDFEELLEEPRCVEREDITKDVFEKEKTQILEINSKTGLYPLYVAYSRYRIKCLAQGEKEFAVKEKQKIWDEVIEKNVFVICNTKMAKAITNRTLLGYRDSVKTNTKHIEDLVNTMKNEANKFIKKTSRANYWNKEGKKMKFDAIVGNPPYQESADNTSDNPVYNLFMDTAFELSDIVSFITPARFLFNAGKTPRPWNEKILNDVHFKVVKYIPNSTEVFPNVDIKGGVAITLRDTNQYFGKIGTFSAFSELSTILDKVINSTDFASIDSMIHLQNKFDLSMLYADYPEYKKIIGSKGKEKRLTTSIFEQLNIFTETRETDTQVEILGLIKNNRVTRFIEKKYIASHKNLMSYKVIVPKSNGSGALGEVLSTPVIGHPQSFISIGSFSTEFEAQALLNFIKTKFARCMLGILKVTQDNKKAVWKYVPVQDFSCNSDIDWNQSIHDIDLQLYDKYGLTASEIDFIETKILEM